MKHIYLKNKHIAITPSPLSAPKKDIADILKDYLSPDSKIRLNEAKTYFNKTMNSKTNKRRYLTSSLLVFLDILYGKPCHLDFCSAILEILVLTDMYFKQSSHLIKRSKKTKKQELDKIIEWKTIKSALDYCYAHGTSFSFTSERDKFKKMSKNIKQLLTNCIRVCDEISTANDKNIISGEYLLHSFAESCTGYKFYEDTKRNRIGRWCEAVIIRDYWNSIQQKQEKLRNEAAATIQREFRRYRLPKRDSAARIIQRYYRGFLGRELAHQRLVRIVKTQSLIRGYLKRKDFRTLKRKTNYIQHWLRAIKNKHGVWILLPKLIDTPYLDKIREIDHKKIESDNTTNCSNEPKQTCAESNIGYKAEQEMIKEIGRENFKLERIPGNFIEKIPYFQNRKHFYQGSGSGDSGSFSNPNPCFLVDARSIPLFKAAVGSIGADETVSLDLSSYSSEELLRLWHTAEYFQTTLIVEKVWDTLLFHGVFDFSSIMPDS
ncbi:hypothetical protein ACFL96_15495 [Thermoproteota archaeon]